MIALAGGEGEAEDEPRYYDPTTRLELWGAELAASDDSGGESSSISSAGNGAPSLQSTLNGQETGVEFATQEFDLPAGRSARPRVQVDMPPEAQLTHVVDGRLVAGAWRALPEDPGISEFLRLAYRSIARRYFLSLTESPAPEEGQ
jgi:hypothetical protein